MPRKPRIKFENAYYHVYNRGVEKRCIFSYDGDREAFLKFLGEIVVFFQLRIFAYCLMENHFHLFLQTPIPNLNQAMQKLQSRYAQYFNLGHKRIGPLFQGRYKCRVIDTDTYFLSLIKYIHNNPIKEGLTARPEDYPWSSYGSYVGQNSKQEWLNTSWVLGCFGTEVRKAQDLFKVFHQVPETCPPSLLVGV